MQTLKKFSRVDSDTDNACYGLGPYVSLTVENPFAYPVTIPRQCDDDRWKLYFNTATLESDLVQGQKYYCYLF
jgi:hypothetical protein